jgi:predicted Rossmann fold flavoprotein
VLQISSFWQEGTSLHIDLAPGLPLADALKQAKSGNRKQLANAWKDTLPDHVPQRLAQTWLALTREQVPQLRDEQIMAEARDKDLETLGHSFNDWAISPKGTEGYAKAEVTVGGVDTRDLNSRSMESKLSPGLHFIGEVVDVTGWLGGYNFQWAWSSGMACARGMAAEHGFVEP